MVTTSSYSAQERRKRVFAIIGASSGNLVEWFDFYIYAFCAIYFAGAFFPKSDPTVQLLSTAGVFAAGFLMRPIDSWIFGRIADRIGRRASMMAFGALGALFSWPLMSLLARADNPFLAFLLILCALAIVSLYTSIAGLVKAEMFPPQVRALGVGLAYAVANAIFGGSAEYVALGLKSLGMESLFYWYVSAMMVVAFLFARRLPRQPAYLHHDL